MKEQWVQKNKEKVADWDLARQIPDMHVHTHWSNHAPENTLEKIVEIMNSHGTWCALNEHLPFPKGFMEYIKKESQKESNAVRIIKYLRRSAINIECFESFLDDVERIKILPIGFEVDVFQGFENATDERIEEAQEGLERRKIKLNHISTTVHAIGIYDIFRPEAVRDYIDKFSAEHLIRTYFDIMCESIQRRDYDFICHQGMVHYFYNISTGKSMMKDKELNRAYHKGYERLIEAAKSTDTCLEINTSGIEKPFRRVKSFDCRDEFVVECSHPHMPRDIMQQAIESGVKLVVGSDWHWPGSEQAYFDQVYTRLVELGAKEVYKIVDREKIAVKLR